VVREAEQNHAVQTFFDDFSSSDGIIFRSDQSVVPQRRVKLKEQRAVSAEDTTTDT
jgi:hypothetical protein